MFEIRRGHALFFWQRFGAGSAVWADVLGVNLSEAKSPAASVSWEPGSYSLSELVILRSLPVGLAKDSRKRFEVLFASTRGRDRFTYAAGPELHKLANAPRTIELELELENVDSSLPGILKIPNWGEVRIDVAPAYWTINSNRFRLAIRRRNEWRIPLPDALVKAIRETLRPAKPPRDDKPAARAEAIKTNG